MANFDALTQALGAGFMQSDTDICRGMAANRAFQLLADTENYIAFINKEYTGSLMKCALRKGRNMIVIGAGVSSSLTRRPEGEGDHLRVVPPNLTGTQPQIDLAGNDWRCSPDWKQLLARVSLILARDHADATLNVDAFCTSVADQLATGNLDGASAIISTAFTRLDQRAAVREVLNMCKMTNDEVALALHGYKSTMVTMNYDYLVTNALPNLRTPQSLHTLVAIAMASESASTVNWINNGAPDVASVYHLHGMMDDVANENGFTLFPEEYNDLTITTDLVRLVTRVIRNPNGSASHKLIFVGAEGTIDDPHFNALWHVLGKMKSGGGDVPWWIPHYVLVRMDLPAGLVATDQAAIALLNRPPPAEHRIVSKCLTIYNTHRILLIPIVYGFEYTDLAPFLIQHMPNW